MASPFEGELPCSAIEGLFRVARSRPAGRAELACWLRRARQVHEQALDLVLLGSIAHDGLAMILSCTLSPVVSAFKVMMAPSSCASSFLRSVSSKVPVAASHAGRFHTAVLAQPSPRERLIFVLNVLGLQMSDGGKSSSSLSFR